MKLLRCILFYLLAAIYGVLCPVIILYAFGTFFSPKDQTLVHTGLVNVVSDPPKATIFLEKSRYTRQTPAILSGLMPGDITLSLLLKNYRPWTHHLTIEPGKALAFDRILMVPQHWPQREIFPDAVRQCIPLPGTAYLLIAKDLKLGDIFVYDQADAKSWPLVTAGSPLATADVLSTSTVAKDTRFIARVSTGDSEKILWIEIKKGKPAALRDITGFFFEKPASLAWEPDEKNILLDIHNDYINHIDLTAKAAAPNTLSGIRGIGLFNKKIYLLRSTNTLEKINIADLSGKTLLADAARGEALFGKTASFQITPLPNDIIIFLGDKGELLASRLPYRFVESGVIGYQFDARHDRLLIFQKDKIGILDFSVEPQDKAFELGPQLNWIYTQGKNIRQAWWAYDASHIIFLDDDEAFILELEPCGAAHTDYITRVAGSIAAHYNDDSGQFIFADPETKKLNTLEIIPNHEI